VVLFEGHGAQPVGLQIRPKHFSGNDGVTHLIGRKWGIVVLKELLHTPLPIEHI
jgi:hypothetical protein